MKNVLEERGVSTTGRNADNNWHLIQISSMKNVRFLPKYHPELN